MVPLEHTDFEHSFVVGGNQRRSVGQPVGCCIQGSHNCNHNLEGLFPHIHVGCMINCRTASFPGLDTEIPD